MGKKFAATKTVAMADLATALEAQLDAPSAPAKDVAATVTVTMAPPEAPAPAPVKRKLTAEEQARHEELWQKAHNILVVAIEELVKEGKQILEAQASEPFTEAPNPPVAGVKRRFTAEELQSIADRQQYLDFWWGEQMLLWPGIKAAKEEETKAREEAFKADLAAREAAVRARKSRQVDNRTTRALENQARAGKKGAGGNGKGQKGGNKGK